MGDMNGMESLRAMAPKWSLAGDSQLLDLLQDTHKNIISKCKDVNSKLDVMASALDDASIDLRNVNNKFMALSNSQFIESRVYDDDVTDSTEIEPTKELPQPSPVDELSIIKNSLAILERAHETAEILDDSDSDSDTEISVVLKPRDMYSARPLPYIIGSQPWRNKWHAGLIVEESDSDSSTSKHDVRDLEEYSDSETEAEDIPRPPLEDHTISEASSSFNSSQQIDNTPPAAPPAVQRPSDIAAELARRLGGPSHLPEREPELYSPPAPTTRKVYKPEQPATSTIFSDEPPPLEAGGPGGGPGGAPGGSDSEDDDIFAEINKRKPYTQPRNTVQNSLADDLFSFDKPSQGADEGDIFSDFADGKVETKPVSQKSTLFEDESKPELFAQQSKKVVQNNNNVEKEQEPSSKKPIGGISLFGSNKGAESIGAAILKRNLHKSSSSGDESGSDSVQDIKYNENPKIMPKLKNEKPDIVAKNIDAVDTRTSFKKEKDIFDDLFSKSEKKTAQKMAKEVPVKVKEKQNVKDLFSDNIFDDIDDIFTSNIKIPAKDPKQKSIFDDDDDLFSDIAKPTSIVNQPNKSKDITSIKDKKSIFDSDDDLFNDIKTDTEKSIKTVESQKVITNTSDMKKESIVKSTETTKERNLFDDSPQNVRKAEIKPQIKPKTIFDSDSDEDIFANINIVKNKNTNLAENTNISIENNLKPLDSKELFKTDNKVLAPEKIKSIIEKSAVSPVSPSIFEEDEIDDLFINENKSSANTESKEIEIDVAKTSIIGDKTVNVLTTNIQTNTISGEVNLPEVIEKNNLEQVKKQTLISNLEDEIDDLFINANKSNTNTECKEIEIEVVKTSIIGDKTVNVLTANIQTNITSSEVQFPEVIEKNNLEQVKKQTLISNPSQKISEEASIFDGKIKENNLFSSEVLEQAILSQTTAEEVVQRNVTELSQEDRKSKSVDARTVSTEDTNEIEHINRPGIINSHIASYSLKPQDQNQSVDENFIVPSNGRPISEHKKQVPNNIFDDIFTEPPEFAKPSEPKKSKNVNALFDDDSDDESLFFKKDDVISDEKPEIFSNSGSFDVYVDEPPAIDVDFNSATKNIQFNQDDDDIFNHEKKSEENVPKLATHFDNNSDLINIVPEKRKPLENNVTLEPLESDELRTDATTNADERNIAVNKTLSGSNDELFSSLPKPKILKNKPEMENFKPKNTDTEDYTLASSDLTLKGTETKKIGKINTKNLNINVNALIPGASPKKVSKERKDEQEENEPKLVKIVPTNDETDNLIPKSLSNKVEIEETNKTEMEKKPKTITFEENLDSEVLDNNASKQRARIQVKRRPSSRRARHEAVRKSAIDFGDETDNSSSLDEPLKNKTQNNESHITEMKREGSVENLEKYKYIDDRQYIDDKKGKDTNKTQEKQDTSIKIQESIPNETICDTNILPTNSKIEKNKQNENKGVVPNKTDNLSINKEIKNAPEHKTTTKVVYVLNDEDIFDTIQNTQTDSIFGTKNLGTKSNTMFENKDLGANSDDDIFKSMQGVSTLGKSYKEYAQNPTEDTEEGLNTTKPAGEVIIKHEDTKIKQVKAQNNPKTTLFENSDEELFNKSKKVLKNNNIFDSDSEDDLFTGKKKTEKDSKEQKNEKVKKKEVTVKGSLFGDDDDDDDDLFGLQKRKPEKKQQTPIPSTSKESAATASKSVEPVFDDPLSMLGDDD